MKVYVEQPHLLVNLVGIAIIQSKRFSFIFVGIYYIVVNYMSQGARNWATELYMTHIAESFLY